MAEPFKVKNASVTWLSSDFAQPVETFLAQFDICCSYTSLNVQDKAAHLMCCLTRVAGQLVWDTGRLNELT